MELGAATKGRPYRSTRDTESPSAGTVDAGPPVPIATRPERLDRAFQVAPIHRDEVRTQGPELRAQASSDSTMGFTWSPGKRPFTCGMSLPMTLPMSFLVLAPTSAMTCWTMAFTSSGVSCLGR